MENLMPSESWGVGNEASAKAFDTILINNQEYDLIFGQHPHSRQDNNIYARSKSGRIEAFDGYRIRTKVEVEEQSYLKESYLSGNEFRKGGSCKIYFDDICCFEFFHRNAQWALIKAHQLIGELKEHESGWASKKQRDKLVGRKIYYRQVPAIIDSLIVEQGCVIIKPASGGIVPPPVYDKDRETDTFAKAEVTDPNIWWFRD
jgi:hypothetical protein